MTQQNTSKQQKLAITLEENAMDSLVHGIEHYLYGKRKSDWKYIVLHVFHAVELFLKARLANHDEKLIYTNYKSGHTVNCVEAIERLINEVNIPLDNYIKCKSNSKREAQWKVLLLFWWKGYCKIQNNWHLKAALFDLWLISLDKYLASRKIKYQLSGELEELRKARNDIEHKEALLDKDAVDKFLGVAFRFLDDFVSRELGLSLSEKLEELDELRWEEVVEAGIEKEDVPEQDSYQALSLAYLSYIKYMSDRGIPLHPKERVDYSFFACEQCGEEAVILPDPRSYSTITYCYNCRAKYEGHTCARCDQTYIEYLGEWEKGDNPPEHPDLESLLNSEEDVSFCEVCQDCIADQ
jgi:hypothetical protein